MASPLPPAPTPPVGHMASNSDRNNLLNLLKFSGQGSQSNPSQPQAYSTASQQREDAQKLSREASFGGPPSSFNPRLIAPAPTNADPSGLLAALMKGTTSDTEDFKIARAPAPISPGAPTSGFGNAPSSFGSSSPPPPDTRTYLLNLLNRPKPSQEDQPLLTEAHSSNITPQSIGMGDIGKVPPPRHSSTSGGSTNPMPTPHPPTSSFEFEPRGFNQLVPAFSNYAVPPTQDSAAATSKLFDYRSSPGSRGSFQAEVGGGVGGSPTFPAFGQPRRNGSGPSSGPFQILKKPQASSPLPALASQEQRHVSGARTPTSSPEHIRQKVDHSSSSAEVAITRTPGTSESFVSSTAPEKNTETVADAVHDIAESVDREAQEALDRAEEERANAEIAHNLEDVLNARSGREFQKSSQVAAKAIKKQLDRDENAHVLEDVFPDDIAQEVREIVEDAAQGITDNWDSGDAVETTMRVVVSKEVQTVKHSIPTSPTDGPTIADNWESADAEEIVVIEEESTPPIKVYNFPMQPWISLTLQEGKTEPRAEFRDVSIMDIARLRKEFDQVDRNLYTATKRYMAYGMSKAGGIRVIRQDDGRDSKLFVDTHDRVFNVSLSAKSSEASVPREAVLGTGISGTVYWAQLREGEKDHIDDTHLEQYGFALPPLSTQDGETPGGVLKTRARVSSSHPEYFAVGRGKSINIIWPAFIMQKNLFKPGHDRVVDTEKLAKQCVLRINTGKAGKDFVFSPDDSVIASLDKSGRVRFWDVRELTAAKEPENSRGLIPAQTSLEVSEPILNLETTLEGEKPWPTSVLLIDKLKPYQKGCALRYMLVGMKQNHTFQLWDLSLGKPVQEINLPHSKESDAVCSVKYHPATGMIVIGHPTRNSIYMIHLSCPKYTSKTVSQAEFIMRLSARDFSVPQPDSTAVLSGVREYSFANRGILRSLDLLATPAMGQEGEELTLFELYVMHSKGVSCLLIKMEDLGWSKDTKVLRPVDAQAAEVVTVAKLKSLASQPVEEIPQSRIATRNQPKDPGSASKEAETSAKDANRSFLHDESSPRKTQEPVTPQKMRQDAKESEAAGNNSNATSQPVEKTGRAARKKKNQGQAQDSQASATNGKTSASAKVPEPVKPAVAPQKPSTLITQDSIDAAVKAMEGRLSTNISGIMSTSMKGFHDKFDDSLRARDDDFDKRQMKLLDIISDVLNDNTQNVLGEMIQKQFKASLIPTIAEATSRAASEQLNGKLNTQVTQAVQKEIQRALPAAVQNALVATDLARAISDRIVAQLVVRLKDEVISALSDQLLPRFTNLTMEASDRAAMYGAEKVQEAVQEQFGQFRAQRSADANKMDQVLSLVTRLSDTVSTMAGTQSQFQGEFLKFQQQAVGDRMASDRMALTSHAPSQTIQSPPGLMGQLGQQSPHGAMHHLVHSPPKAPMPPANINTSPPMPGGEMDPELAHHISAVNALFREGKLEPAIIRWLQSGREQDIFNQYWYRMRPSELENLPPLVQLSVAATVSREMGSSLVRERTAWLETCIHCLYNSVPTFDSQIKEVTPNIMNLVSSAVENLLIQISNINSRDPLIQNLSQLIGVIHRILASLRAPGSQYH